MVVVPVFAGSWIFSPWPHVCLRTAELAGRLASTPHEDLQAAGLLGVSCHVGAKNELLTLTQTWKLLLN